jgi:hypothetical protein
MSERHSVSILNLLREYDSFLDSLKTIVDVGCGTGEDITWWATLETRDDPPVPYNYNCFAVDRDASKLSQIPNLTNIHKMERDFNGVCVPVNADLMFAHDCLQYSTDPIATLRNWNKLMNVNAMLILSVPQHSGVEDNKYYSRSHSGCFYHYTPVNLIYMLAVNGFDCRDAYLLKKFNDPWINIAVYKSNVEPMDPTTTTWYDLVDKGLLHPTVINSVNKFGYLRQEDVLYPWLDKENYYIDYVSTWTEIPKEAGEPKIDGIFNTRSTVSKENIIKQAKQTTIETKILKPVGVRRPPKKYQDKDNDQ